MSTLSELKDYLLGKDEDVKSIGYLLDPNNNGKTVMLSGAWGSGKTYFWQNEIERQQQKINGVDKFSDKDYKDGLSYLLEKKSCVYISLYGKDNIEDIKSQVFAKAYAQIPKKGNKDKNIDKAVEWLGYGSKIVSALSLWGAKIDTSELADKAKNYQDNERLSQAQEAIKDGGVICFDDFERKSKNIDLNDLFGVLTQLSLEFNCKVVIILNSDVFKGKEKSIFTQVKEKTVSKYLFFKPKVSELFNIIFKDYTSLKSNKEKIQSTFEEVNIINARIYKQVLDNIKEWAASNKDVIGDGDILRYFILVNINFILTHYILKAELVNVPKNGKDLLYDQITGESTPNREREDIVKVYIVDNGLEYEIIDEYIKDESNYNESFIENLMQKIKNKEKSNTAKSGKYDNSEALIEFINNNQSFIKSLHFIYAFELDKYGKSHNQAEVDILNNINRFIETGII